MDVRVGRKRVKAACVEPIRNRQDIERLREYFLATGRYGAMYALLITCGVNLGLRASDLRLLRVGDLRGKKYLDIQEKKTQKVRHIYINQKVHDAVDEYLKPWLFIADFVYLFEGQKGDLEPIEARHIHKVIKGACRALGIEGNYGSHSLRKTFAYHAFKRKPNIDTLQEAFQHSDAVITRRYIAEQDYTKGRKIERTVDELYAGLNL